MCKMTLLILATIGLLANSALGGKVLGLCGQDQFACTDGRQCVESGRVCDTSRDCDDGSDEAKCRVTSMSQCQFCYRDTCGWNVTNRQVDKNSYHQECGLVQEKYSNMITLVSPVLDTTAKSCELSVQFDTQSASFDRFGVYALHDKTRSAKIVEERYVNDKVHSVHIGYVEQGGQLIINGTFNSQPGKITNVRMTNCDMSKIPLDCTLEDNSHCPWWFPSTRFAQWEFVDEFDNNYMEHDDSHLAEIRSPLIKKKDLALCLEFAYRITGQGNYLRVTKINYGKNTDESVIWIADHSSGAEDNVNLQPASVTIESEFDFDVGFISSAVEGRVLLDNIRFKEGSCKVSK